MARPVFFISTETEKWQERCKHWAKDGETFRVKGIQKSHLPFCREFCAAFNYDHKLSKDGDRVSFRPLRDTSK